MCDLKKESAQNWRIWPMNYYSGWLLFPAKRSLPGGVNYS